jgi:hypothetical protein
MRFMMMVVTDGCGGAPDPKLMAAVNDFSAKMTKAGVLLDSGGLLPSALGARIEVEPGGELVVRDGPFAESKELIGGYAIIEAKTKAEAIEYGRKFVKLHTDVLGADYSGRLEIRQMMG